MRKILKVATLCAVAVVLLVTMLAAAAPAQADGVFVCDRPSGWTKCQPFGISTVTLTRKSVVPVVYRFRVGVLPKWDWQPLFISGLQAEGRTEGQIDAVMRFWQPRRGVLISPHLNYTGWDLSVTRSGNADPPLFGREYLPGLILGRTQPIYDWNPIYPNRDSLWYTYDPAVWRKR
jgi:hypothetical protein